MSAFIYKVIVRGKVFGEATTLAEAEAAAKKHGGKVLQEMGKTSNPGAAFGALAKKQGDDLRALARKVLREIKQAGYLVSENAQLYCYGLAKKIGLSTELPHRLKMSGLPAPSIATNFDTVLAKLGPDRRIIAVFCYELLSMTRDPGAWDYSNEFVPAAFGTPKTSNPRASGLSLATKQAIQAYGIDACRKAFDMHDRLGYGASGIVQEGPVTIRTTRQADAAINAGRELAGAEAVKAKTSNPHEDEYIPVQQALSPFATAWFALMKSKGGREAAQARSLLPLYRDGTVNDRSLFLTTSGADLAKLPAPAAAMARPLAGRASNPPLEHSNAAILLDTVKPGKPQVIHGVKVSRVGSGYSIDRMVLSREMAIKRLEQGGKTANPKAERLANPSVRNGNYFGQTESGDIFAAATLDSLRKKADKLRRQGEVVESTAYKQIGSGQDGYAQPIPNALGKYDNPKAKPAGPVVYI